MKKMRERGKAKSRVARSRMKRFLLLAVLAALLLVPSCASPIKDDRYDGYRARVNRLRETLSTSVDEPKVGGERARLRELARRAAVNDLVLLLDWYGLMCYVVPDKDRFEDLEQTLAQFEQAMGVEPGSPTRDPDTR